MNTLKTRVKELVGETLLRSGLWERGLRRWARRGEAIVLTYHRVIEKWDRTLDYSQPGMVVTAETFNRQLSFLKKHFHIVSLSSLVSSQSEIRNPKSFERPMCALTFDDGWRDNYEIAFPILQKYEIPATIFLSTDFIGTNRVFWHTELMYLLLDGNVPRIAKNLFVFRAYPERVCRRLMRLATMRKIPNAHDVNLFIDTVKEECREYTIRYLIRDVTEVLGIKTSLLAERRFFVDWDQVREMAAAGMEIGSHGCSHRILTRLKADEADNELIRSKTEIERRISQEVRHFAFPDGAANRSLMESAGRAGYESVSLLSAAPDEGNAGMLTLRRVGMHEGTSAGSNWTFSETSLLSWLLRAPTSKPGLLQP